MPRGRKPRVIQDNEVTRRTKKDVENLQKYTPFYASQNFIPPETLTKAELVVWEWLVKVIRDTRGSMVSDADVHIMENYCRAKVAADEADAELKRNRQEFVLIETGLDKNGNKKFMIKPNPNVKKRKDNMELCLKFSGELGLTPLSRARVGMKAANAKKEQDIYDFLNSRTD